MALSRHKLNAKEKGTLEKLSNQGVAPSYSAFALESRESSFPQDVWAEIAFKISGNVTNISSLRLHIRTLVQDSYAMSFYAWLSPSQRVSTLLRLFGAIQSITVEVEPAQLELKVTDAYLRNRNKFSAAVTLMASEFDTPRRALQFLKSHFMIFREGGWVGLRAALRFLALKKCICLTDYYSTWVSEYSTLTDCDRKAIRDKVSELIYRPLISIVMPVFNTDERWLRAAIESVRAQIYPHWELCIADDKSTKPEVREILEEYATKDSRIKVVFREENGHISAASNSARRIATGEYTALLDHDDELAEHALYMVVNELNLYPDVRLVYSDEDKIDVHGRRFDPHFKPNWNPDLFYSYNLVTHLAVFKTAPLREIGGFRVGYEGSQDYDLVLRYIERIDPRTIRHIPEVLYHWRAIPGSVALNTNEKKYAEETARKALRSHFRRRNLSVDVEPGFGPFHRVKYHIESASPLVTLIVCTRDKIDLLRELVHGILNETDYEPIQLLIVDNQSKETATIKYLERLSRQRRVCVLKYDAPFNFSAMNNWAAGQASATILGFLNNDLEVISSHWLSEMVSHVLRPEVGIVGAKLYYPNNTIQHAGVILGLGGVAGHVNKNLPRTSADYMGRANVIQQFSAVTGACMLIRKTIFEKVGGFNEENLPIAFNDIDLCLRIQENGYSVLWTPYAELYHKESASRGLEDTPEKRARFEREADYMINRWKGKLLNDPHYNPNLSLATIDFSFAFPPRVRRPWEEPKTQTHDSSN